MDIVFYRILTMSLLAGIMILIVIPLRFILRKASRRLMLVFWLLVGLRLILPFTFDSRISLIPEELSAPVNLSGTSSEKTIFSGIIEEEDEGAAEDTAVPVQESAGEEKNSGTAFRLNKRIILNIVIPAVWLLGMGSLLLYLIISAAKLHRNEKNAVHFTDNIYRIREGKTAYVSGLIRPRIYLPASVTGEELKLVLAHERGHIQWKDHIAKWIACLLLCVYWFNPLIWIGYVLFCCDLEYACDEYVTRRFDPEEKSRYSEVLLGLSTSNGAALAKPLTFGEVNVKRRIWNILQERRKSWILNICIIAAALGLIACTMSTAETVSVKPVDSTTESTVKEGTLADVYSVSYDGFHCYSRFEKYQPGTNDVHIIIETEGKAVRVENGLRLEKEEPDGSWTIIPRTERYLKALEEAGLPTETGEGFLSMGEHDTTSLFWLCKTRLEDEPLEEGNYRVVFTANDEERQCPFIVSKDGWDGKPERWTELRTRPAIFYQGQVYYRSNARTSKGSMNETEADTATWKELGVTEKKEAEDCILTKDLECLALSSGNQVFYDEANDRILAEQVFEGKTSYYILDEKVLPDRLK